MKLFFRDRDNKLAYDRDYHRRLQVKMNRIKNYIQKLKDEIEKQKRDKSRGATYFGKGGGFQTENNTNQSSTKKQTNNNKKGEDQ